MGSSTNTSQPEPAQTVADRIFSQLLASNVPRILSQDELSKFQAVEDDTKSLNGTNANRIVGGIGTQDMTRLFALKSNSLFPLLSSYPSSSTEIQPLKPFLDSILRFASIPLPTLFHAYHLLLRLPSSFSPAVVDSLALHRLILGCITISVRYNLSVNHPAAALRFWSLKSGGIFTLKEMARMEMEVLMCLEKGVRDLDEEKVEVIVEGYERSFEEWLRVEREKERRKAIKKQVEAMRARKVGRGG